METAAGWLEEVGRRRCVCGAIQIKINNVCCLIGACNKCCFPNCCICKINNEGSFYVCLCRMPAASAGRRVGVDGDA